MSEKRFAGPVEGLDGTALAADYEIAAAYDKLRVGKLAVYYRDGFRVKAIPYARMERAFIRVQEVRGRMCCGQAFFAYFRMVLVAGGKEYDYAMSEKEQLMRDALAAIAANAPALPIGVPAK